MTATAVDRRKLPLAIPVAIGLAWAAAIAAHATGWAHHFHHDALVGDNGHLDLGALAGFAGLWTVMIAAMMLPSAVPLFRLFVVAASDQFHRARVLASFAAGYAAVWTAFGFVALQFDAVVHRSVDAFSWVAAHQWLVGAAILGLAGAFQFSELKDRCLTQCRHPGAYLLRHYRRGAPAAFTLGWSHGLFCLGCCWALMLVMFAAGVADLRWMAALGVVMAYEKVGRHGETLAAAVGVSAIILAILVAAHPSWLPNLFATT